MTTTHFANARGELHLRPGFTLNKVPEVLAIFWVIKILATTVGETAADYLNATLGFGLTNTSLVVGALFLAVIAVQFRAPRYVAPLYWSAVVLISVVGTLITDNLTDVMGVPLWQSTALFSALLAGTFAWWYRSEGTLSIHSVVTPRREGYYWLAILFTFALGTAAGDLIGESFGLGYLNSLLLFAAVIGAIAVAYFVFKIDAILAFWLAYIMTRPLGASLGDLLSQDRSAGGLGLGTTMTSAVFLTAIVALVAYLSVSRSDIQELHQHPEFAEYLEA